MPTNWKSYDSAVRLLSAIIAADPSRKLDYAEISRFYGDGTSYKAVWGRCQTFLQHAEAQKLAVDAGIDPNTVEFKEASSGKAYKAISGEFGQGEMSTPVKATPRKRAAKGSASKAKNGKGLSGSGVDENDDDEGSDFATPSKKKGALNKVKNGRVGKSKGHGASQSFGPDDDYEDMGGAVKFEGGDDYEDGNDMGDMSFDYDSTKHQYYDVDDDDQA